MIMSFIALYILDKARNGAIVAVSQIIDKLTMENLILFFGVTLVVAGIIIITNTIISNVKQIENLIYFAAIFPLIFFYLLISMKTIEHISMRKAIPTNKLVEGDWVNEEIKINGKIIYSPKSLGVNKKQIELIKKHKKNVQIREGIAFVPAFLIGTIISLIWGNLIFLS